MRKYTVRFYNGTSLLQTVQNVPYGGSATYTGTTPVSPDGSAEDYPFEGWNPLPTNIQGNTDCRAVFGSPVELKEITDSWDQIIAACADGTCATKYKLGNYKPLDLGSEGVINMQIVGKDVDTLADGSGMAPLTWIGIELLKTSRRMNPALSGPSGNYVEGTGSIGGWEMSEMRTYFKETIKPLIPENVRSAIKTILKSHPAYNSAGTSFTQTTEDDVWPPSYIEMAQISGSKNQPRYKAVFPDIESLKKSNDWWLRSTQGTTAFYYVRKNGNTHSGNTKNLLGVVLAFCT